jgi:hypothetical protein
MSEADTACTLRDTGTVRLMSKADTTCTLRDIGTKKLMSEADTAGTLFDSRCITGSNLRGHRTEAAKMTPTAETACMLFEVSEPTRDAVM